MSEKNSRTQLVDRRGELLAELFLQELSPEFVFRLTRDDDYDFLIGFPNSRGGINNIPVVLKATEHLDRRQYPISKRQYDRFSYSNTPVLLLVVDVKNNELYYAWFTQEFSKISEKSKIVQVQLIEIDDESKEDLRTRLAT